MILINNEWYNPKDLDDVSTIVREEFSYDLADKMDELVKEINLENDTILELAKDEIEDLTDYIDSIREDISELNQEIESLNEQIEYWSSEVCDKEE